MNGFYSYEKERGKVKTRYDIEWTFDEKKADKHERNGDPELLNHKSFDFLEDAMCFYNQLFYAPQPVYFLHMMETVLIDEEDVLEQFKEATLPIVSDEITRQKVREAEQRAEAYKRENDLIHGFLEKYHATEAFNEYIGGEGK